MNSDSFILAETNSNCQPPLIQQYPSYFWLNLTTDDRVFDYINNGTFKIASGKILPLNLTRQRFFHPNNVNVRKDFFLDQLSEVVIDRVFSLTQIAPRLRFSPADGKEARKANFINDRYTYKGIHYWLGRAIGNTGANRVSGYTITNLAESGYAILDLDSAKAVDFALRMGLPITPTFGSPKYFTEGRRNLIFKLPKDLQDLIVENGINKLADIHLGFESMGLELLLRDKMGVGSFYFDKSSGIEGIYDWLPGLDPNEVATVAALPDWLADRARKAIPEILVTRSLRASVGEGDSYTDRLINDYAGKLIDRFGDVEALDPNIFAPLSLAGKDWDYEPKFEEGKAHCSNPFSPTNASRRSLKWGSGFRGFDYANSKAVNPFTVLLAAKFGYRQYTKKEFYWAVEALYDYHDFKKYDPNKDRYVELTSLTLEPTITFNDRFEENKVRELLNSGILKNTVMVNAPMNSRKTTAFLVVYADGAVRVITFCPTNALGVATAGILEADHPKQPLNGQKCNYAAPVLVCCLESIHKIPPMTDGTVLAIDEFEIILETLVSGGTTVGRTMKVFSRLRTFFLDQAKMGNRVVLLQDGLTDITVEFLKTVYQTQDISDYVSLVKVDRKPEMKTALNYQRRCDFKDTLTVKLAEASSRKKKIILVTSSYSYAKNTAREMVEKGYKVFLVNGSRPEQTAPKGVDGGRGDSQACLEFLADRDSHILRYDYDLYILTPVCATGINILDPENKIAAVFGYFIGQTSMQARQLLGRVRTPEITRYIYISANDQRFENPRFRDKEITSSFDPEKIKNLLVTRILNQESTEADFSIEEYLVDLWDYESRYNHFLNYEEFKQSLVTRLEDPYSELGAFIHIYSLIKARSNYSRGRLRSTLTDELEEKDNYDLVPFTKQDSYLTKQQIRELYEEEDRIAKLVDNEYAITFALTDSFESMEAMIEYKREREKDLVNNPFTDEERTRFLKTELMYHFYRFNFNSAKAVKWYFENERYNLKKTFQYWLYTNPEYSRHLDLINRSLLGDDCTYDESKKRLGLGMKYGFKVNSPVPVEYKILGLTEFSKDIAPLTKLLCTIPLVIMELREGKEVWWTSKGVYSNNLRLLISEACQNKDELIKEGLINADRWKVDPETQSYNFASLIHAILINLFGFNHDGGKVIRVKGEKSLDRKYTLVNDFRYRRDLIDGFETWLTQLKAKELTLAEDRGQESIFWKHFLMVDEVVETDEDLQEDYDFGEED